MLQSLLVTCIEPARPHYTLREERTTPMERTSILLVFALSTWPMGLFAQVPVAQNGGGVGRGDASAAVQPAPLSSSIHAGGVGRGDVSATMLITPITTLAHAGGAGRGDGQVSLLRLPPIGTTVVLDSLCAGSTLSVSWQPFQPFNPGNVFTIQLSDADGSFDDPIAIGSLSGTTSASVDAVVPSNTPGGAAYRVRVVGSSPPAIGAASDVVIEITPQLLWYFDADGDGLGDPLVQVSACTQPVGHVANAFDTCPLIPGVVGSPCQAPDDCGPTVVNALCQCVPVDPCVGIYGGEGGRGDASVHLQPDPLPSTVHGGGTGRGDMSVALSPTPLPSLIHAGGTGRGDAIAATVLIGPSMSVAVRVVLEGPYDPDTGLMGDALRSLSSFPLTEPYTGMGQVLVGGGGETTSTSVLSITGNNAIVDWVIVEVREASTHDVVASRAALLQRDGDVVDVDGLAPLGFSLPLDHYKISVLHRNHLGVVTSQPVTYGQLSIVDLTKEETNTYGLEGRKSITGTFPVQALWAGDVTFDGVIKYTGENNDRDPILTAIGGIIPTSTITGYHGTDVNLDGTVKYTGEDNDRDPILQNIGGVVPTNVRVEQVP